MQRQFNGRMKWRPARVLPVALLLLGGTEAVRGQQPPAPANPAPTIIQEEGRPRLRDRLGLTRAPAALTVAGQTPPATGEATPGDAAPAPVTGTPPGDVEDGVAAGQPGRAKPKSVWDKVPPVVKTPRVGNFIIPPTGPGYYSFLDLIEDHYRDKPPTLPWPPTSADAGSFFDNDFRYLDKPDNTQHDFFDPLKRIHLGCDWLLSVGGEERVRFVNELDSRLSGRNDNYQLLRSRVYADLWYKDRFRVYAEYIDAQSYNQDLPPLAIDVNKSDFLNLFGELKLLDLYDEPVYVRVGRQELLYGSERLISPLDWANTRRTFQGVKGYWHSEKLDVDAFWVQPVNIDPTHFDSPDDGRQFAGLWTTYKPRKGQAIDLYYLYLDSTRPTATGRRGTPGGFRVNTFGSRYAGDYEGLLWDFEGMYQFGDWSDLETQAGAWTTGLGYHFADLPLTPTFWAYYDWASGDHNPGVGHHGTFNQLFPFGHYYFGFIDVVGRQNIQDFNLHAYFYPTKWIVSGVQYHMFRLESARDALYNAAGTAIRRDPRGLSGSDVGDEVDFTTNFHLTFHQDILVGYSKLFAGEFIKRTGSPRSPEYFYVQYSFRW